MNADGADPEEKYNNIVLPFTNMYKNELNGIPAIVQSSIPTAV